MYRGNNPRKDIGASLAEAKVSTGGDTIESLADKAFGGG
jgi:hypothetical protein